LFSLADCPLLTADCQLFSLVTENNTAFQYISQFSGHYPFNSKSSFTPCRFASFLINGGRPLYEVQKILGHTQVKTTQRYAHLSQDSLISAANTAMKSLPLLQLMPKQVGEVALLTAKAG